MAGTYSQIYIQFVFAVKGRDSQLQKPWRDELFKFICGIIMGKNQKPIIVNGVSDHVHVFVSIKPSMNIADLVRDIKNNSSRFINENKFTKCKFSWQEGYSVFSYGHSQIDAVYRYISNQEIHHKKKTFQEEYIEFLEKFEIDFDAKYLFQTDDE